MYTNQTGAFLPCQVSATKIPWHDMMSTATLCGQNPWRTRPAANSFLTADGPWLACNTRALSQSINFLTIKHQQHTLQPSSPTWHTNPTKQSLKVWMAFSAMLQQWSLEGTSWYVMLDSSMAAMYAPDAWLSRSWCFGTTMPWRCIQARPVHGQEWVCCWSRSSWVLPTKSCCQHHVIPRYIGCRD